MDYERKYVKYKCKYSDLKQKQLGINSIIFDTGNFNTNNNVDEIPEPVNDNYKNGTVGFYHRIKTHVILTTPHEKCVDDSITYIYTENNLCDLYAKKLAINLSENLNKNHEIILFHGNINRKILDHSLRSIASAILLTQSGKPHLH